MKKITTICIAALLAGGFSGCSDFLEEYSQDAYYAQSWEDLDELLIGSCYMPVSACRSYQESTNIGAFLPFLTDEVEENNYAFAGAVEMDTHERLFGFYTWQQRVGQNETYTDFYEENAAWTKCYYCINVANNILAAAETLPQNTDAEVLGVARVKGEACFLRAYYYFWLVNLYGKPYDAQAASHPGVPVKLSENVEDRKFTRNSVKEVYDRILADLDVAGEMLGMQTQPKKSIYRADSTAVNLLRSRVCLYMQDWEQAAAYAGRVIKAVPVLENLNETSSAFMRKDNPEMLFSMGGTDMPLLFYFGYKSYRVSRELYDSYVKEDLRKSKWFWAYNAFVGPTKYPEINIYTDPPTKDNNEYYFYMYYNSWRGTNAEVSSTFLLRTAEAYLNYAEAQACLGHETEAMEALKTLRAARYTGGAVERDAVYSGEELVAAIRGERCKELVLEGHRWFDLRRYQVCGKYPYAKTLVHDYTYYAERTSSKMTECHRFVLEPGDDGYTLPIPESVIRFNTGMGNNPRPWREYEIIPLKNN